MNDEIQIPVAIPLDRDGFMRRECPTCDRELKWRPTSENEEPAPVPDGGYYCPYCGVQAQPETWLTKAQVNHVQTLLKARVVDPMIDKFGDDLRRIARNSRGTISVQTHRQPTEEPQALTEDDDMRRVDFSCHLSEPVKVLDDWSGPVRCIICGQEVS